MVRSLLLAAAMCLPAVVLVSPAQAQACSKGTCALRGKSGTTAAAKGSKGTQARPAAQKVTPASDAQFRKDVENALADRCSCSSAADCTCKKGACKCPRCRGHQRASGTLINPLKGSVDPQAIPAKARRDATAGLFI